MGKLGAHDANDLGASLLYFPIVGIVVALIGALVFALAATLWPVPLAVFVSIAVTVSVTGAFHEDALADAIDGFGGGWDAEHVLAIMKDSRVGSYALVGMILAIAVKAAALVAIADAAAENRLAAVARALIAAHVLARWSSVILIARWPYVRAATPGGRAPAGAAFVDTSTPARASLATVIAWAGAAIALDWHALALAALGVATVVTVLGGRYAGHRIGGITGDVLGAVNQLVELVTYLVLAAHPWR